MTDDEEVFVSQRLADELRKDSTDVPDFGALIRHHDLRDLLILLDNHWSEFSSDETPDDFRETAIFSRLAQMYGSRNLLDFLDSANTTGLGYFLGDDSDVIDASNLETHEFLRELLSDDGSDDSFALYGPRNAAKSSFASQIVRTLKDEKDAVVLSNSKTPLADHRPTSMTDLCDLALGDSEYIASYYQNGIPPRIDRQKDVVFWFAEASSYCKATRYQHQLNQQFFPYMHRFAKLNIHLVYEFHGPMTSHAVFRRPDNVRYYVHKPDQKTALFYDSMNEDDGSFSDLIARLDDVQPPRSNLAPGPDDPSPWSWDLDDTLV